MGMYAPESLPVMTKLARSYAVCDSRFCSAPTQTIPNRAFAASGTSQGHLDNQVIPNRAFAASGTSQGHLDNQVKVFTCKSIFGALSDAGMNWAIYGYSRDPLTQMDFPDTQSADQSHFGHFRDFQQRAKAGTLPPYTFLEPTFGAAVVSQATAGSMLRLWAPCGATIPAIQVLAR